MVVVENDCSNSQMLLLGIVLPAEIHDGSTLLLTSRDRSLLSAIHLSASRGPVVIREQHLLF